MSGIYNMVGPVGTNNPVVGTCDAKGWRKLEAKASVILQSFELPPLVYNRYNIEYGSFLPSAELDVPMLSIFLSLLPFVASLSVTVLHNHS